jgi:methyl farnesoate epoxidase/farnesoate epoxidase
LLILGEAWKEQRRFALKHLRDLGFGKSSMMEEIIREEFVQLAEKFRENGGKEVDSHQLFNLTVVNVIWGIVAGKR